MAKSSPRVSVICIGELSKIIADIFDIDDNIAKFNCKKSLAESSWWYNLNIYNCYQALLNIRKPPRV